MGAAVRRSGEWGRGRRGSPSTDRISLCTSRRSWLRSARCTKAEPKSLSIVKFAPTKSAQQHQQHQHTAINLKTVMLEVRTLLIFYILVLSLFLQQRWSSTRLDPDFPSRSRSSGVCAAPRLVPRVLTRCAAGCAPLSADFKERAAPRGWTSQWWGGVVRVRGGGGGGEAGLTDKSKIKIYLLSLSTAQHYWTNGVTGVSGSDDEGIQYSEISIFLLWFHFPFIRWWWCMI